MAKNVVTFYRVEEFRWFIPRRYRVIRVVEMADIDPKLGRFTIAKDELEVSRHFTYLKAAVRAGSLNTRQREIDRWAGLI